MVASYTIVVTQTSSDFSVAVSQPITFVGSRTKRQRYHRGYSNQRIQFAGLVCLSGIACWNNLQLLSLNRYAVGRRYLNNADPYHNY